MRVIHANGLAPGLLRRATAFTCLATWLATCSAGPTGGHESPGPAMTVTTVRASTSVIDATAAANQLMDYGEHHFPDLFPGSAPTLTFESFLYRYYPSTQIYLGVSVGGVYVLGGKFGSSILYVGQITDFISPQVAEPTITLEPASASVGVGVAATFTVEAIGSSAPSYQWQVSLDGGLTFADIGGANAASYSTGATVLSDSGKQFRAVARNGAGTAVSARAVLTVKAGGAIAGRVDTGIRSDQCFAAGVSHWVNCASAAAVALNPAQDGMTGRDVTHPDSADGKLGFSYRAIPGGCVKDELTGLTWEVKTVGIGGLRDEWNTFTNLGNGQPGDSSAYVAAVNAQGLCGYTDWRIPTADELQSLVDYSAGLGTPGLDPAWFPDNGFLGITSDPYVTDIASNWLVGAGGSIGRGLRTTPSTLRLVR